MQKTSTRGIVIVLLLLLTSVSSYAQSGRRNILIYVLSDRYEDDRWRDWYRNPAHLDGIVDDLQSIGFRCEVIDRKIGPSLPISRLHEFSQVWISECDNDAVLDTTMQEVTALHEFCMTGGGVWLSMEGTLYGGSDDWKEDIVPYAESFGCEWVGNHYGSYPRAVAPSAHPVLYHIKWLHFNSEVGALASSSGQMESIWDYATGFTGIMVTDGFRLGQGRRLVDAGWLLGYCWYNSRTQDSLDHGNLKCLQNIAHWLEPGGFNLSQITDRVGEGTPCSDCCQIVHRQPIMAPAGDQFVFASTWNRDAAVGNLNPDRNMEVFRYDTTYGLFYQDTITNSGISVPFDYTDRSVAFISSSPELPANADTNADLFVYASASPTNPEAVTVTTGPLELDTNPSFPNTITRWATQVLNFSSQYSDNLWSAAQTLGEPDTYPSAGDSATAWASKTSDAQREFLELAYGDPHPIDTIAVYETLNPGAVYHITIRNANNGMWETVWLGQATDTTENVRVFQVEFPLTSYPVDAVRIELDSPAVSGWNEIDAVSLITSACPTTWFPDTHWWTLANTHADVSADGEFVVWTGNRNIPSVGSPEGNNADKNYEIWLRDLTINATFQLTRTIGGESESPAIGANLWPRVTSGGRRVLFVSNRDLSDGAAMTNRYGLYQWTPEEGITMLMTADLIVQREFPAFGMDDAGTKVTFASDADLTGQNPDGNKEIFAVSLSSGDISQITDTSAGTSNSRPILSGDGKKIAFLSNGKFNIDGLNSDGSEELWVYHFDPDHFYIDPFIQVTNINATPSVSQGRTHWMDWYTMDHDGSHLVFCSNADMTGQNTGNYYEIFLATFYWEEN